MILLMHLRSSVQLTPYTLIIQYYALMAVYIRSSNTV